MQTLVYGDGTSISLTGGLPIVGGPGNDVLNGGSGNDTYIYNIGDGSDTIYETGGNNTVAFGQGISDNQLWFAQQGNNLVIDDIGTSDKITVQNWYSGSSNQIQTFTTAAGLKLDTQIAQLVSAMATFSANNPGFDPTQASQMPADTNLQNTIAAAWHT